MHWSRLSDILIGGPIKLLTPLFGAANAELIILVAYPALLLLAFLYLIVAVTSKLTDNKRVPMAAAFFAALSYGVMSQFGIGRIDHHGLQIILALLSLWFIIRSAQKIRYAAFAGIFSGLGLYVGIESAPAVAAACVCIVLVWIFGEENCTKRLRAFGLALASTAVITLLISTKPSAWFTPHCDALSVVYVQLCIGIALALWALSRAGYKVKTPLYRFGLAALLGLAALGITIVLFPNCLRGPYAGLDPRLTEIWLSNVSEAGKYHDYLLSDFAGASPMILLPLIASAGYWLFHKLTKNGLAIAPRSIFIFMFFSFLTGLIQTRMMSYATCLAIPFAAYLLVTGLSKADEMKSSFKAAIMRIGLLTFLAPITLPLLFSALSKMPSVDNTPTEQTTQTPKLKCLNGAALAPLNGLPKGIALTQIDLGAPVLAASHHSVTSAPYHRNTSGILAAIDAFTGTEQEAYQAAKTSQADYVIACDNGGETGLFLGYQPDGFLASLLAGDVPDWLEQIDLGAPSHLLVYKVSPQP